MRGSNAHRSESRAQIASAIPVDGRLSLLVEAGMALTAELSLDGLLQRLIETAANLTGARYVALGVVDADGSRLECFVTHGIDAETRASMGTCRRATAFLAPCCTTQDRCVLSTCPRIRARPASR
jgi:hypothetical protein